jgi:hypothetical protein
MKERTILLIYLLLLVLIFAPYTNYFMGRPLLTIGWILGDLIALVLLTTFVYLKVGFGEDDDEYKEITKSW